MKWIVASAVILTIPMCAVEDPYLIRETDPCAPNYSAENDPDLFRKSAQITAVHAEFLYWTISEGALDYALKMRHAAWGPTASYAQGRFENAGYGFDPGFRVGFLFFRACHNWEIKWQYTRLTCVGEDSVSKPAAAEKFITGTWPQITTAPLAGARSRIHMNYNVYDMMADRVFNPNEHLRLRVIIGGVLTWMSQDWNIRYFDSTPNTTTIQNRWQFIGGGLKSGTMADWFWTHDLYLTALGTFGLVMGSYANQAKQRTTFQPTPADDTNIPIRDTSFNDVRPVFTAQMLLGPSWQKKMGCKRVEIFAGYEMNFWFNLHEVYRSTSNVPSGAKETWINNGLLALYGLTTRASLDF